MRRLIPLFVMAVGASVTINGCFRARRLDTAGGQLPTVLKVENQGFPDMNIYVVPEGSGRVRLGTVTGNTNAYFTLPSYVVPAIRTLRFQALPIATPRGEVSESITVTPGDTVVLTIPPG